MSFGREKNTPLPHPNIALRAYTVLRLNSMSPAGIMIIWWKIKQYLLLLVLLPSLVWVCYQLLRGCQKFSFVVLKVCRVHGHSPCTWSWYFYPQCDPQAGIREQAGSWSGFAFRQRSANVCQHPTADWISAPSLGLKLQIPGQIGWWEVKARGGGRLRRCSFWSYDGEYLPLSSLHSDSERDVGKGSGLCFCWDTSAMRTEEHTPLYIQLFGITTHNI